MSRLFLAIFFLLFSLCSFSQQITEITENTPYTFNGLEYGFYITNERSKEVKGEDYDRYEVNLYVTNKSGCLKWIPLRTSANRSGSSTEETMIAEFNCRNATGKRLTAKSGKVAAKAFYTQVKVYDENAPKESSSSSSSSKYKIINAHAGYAIKNGETLTNKIIVIVPKGERPKLTLRTVYIE